jgi:hypothetical protein
MDQFLDFAFRGRTEAFGDLWVILMHGDGVHGLASSRHIFKILAIHLGGFSF